MRRETGALVSARYLPMAIRINSRSLHPRSDDALPMYRYHSAKMEEALRQSLGASLRMPLEVVQFEPRGTELP
jgi:hypothetical protein